MTSPPPLSLLINNMGGERDADTVRLDVHCLYAPRLSSGPHLPGDVTGAGTRLVAAVLAAALLASGSLLSGRGTVDTDPSLPPAVHPFPSEGAAEGVVLTRVYPNAARDDEFVEVANPGPFAVDVGGWALSDREGVARFPDATVLLPGGRTVVARNSTSYAEDVLRDADLTWDLGDAPHMLGGILRLADGGDEVLLLDGSDALVDAYVYGGSSYAGSGWTGPAAPAPSRGEIAVREGGDSPMDRDRAEDWIGPRPHRLGQSDFDAPEVALDGAIVPVLSPDDGAGSLLRFLASARASIQVAVYTLTSEAIAATLADRARRGVRVQVLLEAAPVGGIEESEARIVGGLVAAGAEVRMLSSASDAVKRYRYLHAKYAVLDDEGILVSSENFGESGWPTGDRSGNRGWSVLVRDPELARQLRDVFDEDFDPKRRDSIPARGDPAGALGPPPEAGPWSWGGARCCRQGRLLIGPDTALAEGGLLGLLGSARSRLRIELFYLEDVWGAGPNPLLEGAFAAARRGVDVRILLDGGAWSTEESGEGNDGVASRINARADAEGLSLEARLLDPAGAIDRVHNKGAVADGRAVLVSSMNWAETSTTENREIGLLLEDPATASRFEAAFEADWDGRSTAPRDSVLVDDPLILAGFYAFVVASSALSLRKLRRGDKGLKLRERFERRGSLRAALRRGRGEVRVLSPELVAEPRPGPGGGPGARGRGEEARDGRGGPEGD